MHQQVQARQDGSTGDKQKITKNKRSELTSYQPLTTKKGSPILSVKESITILLHPNNLFLALHSKGLVRMRKARLLFPDTQAGLLAAVRRILESEVDVVGAVDNGESLFEADGSLKPDITVTDISIPKISVIEAANRQRDSGCSSKVVFLTVHTHPDVLRVALQTGGLAYVFKTLLAEDLLFAVQEALPGRTFVSSATRAD